jgi:hypothetical protein
MKQSTFIIYLVILLLAIIFLAGFAGYKLHRCQTYIDSPIEKPQPDSSNLATIDRLTKELKQLDSLLKIKPKILIYEKAVYYRDLNKSALCDSVTKRFGSGFDLL